jgi:hypothetical protein
LGPNPICQLHPPKAPASPTDATSRTPFTQNSRLFCFQGPTYVRFYLKVQVVFRGCLKGV